PLSTRSAPLFAVLSVTLSCPDVVLENVPATVIVPWPRTVPASAVIAPDTARVTPPEKVTVPVSWSRMEPADCAAETLTLSPVPRDTLSPESGTSLHDQ